MNKNLYSKYSELLEEFRIEYDAEVSSIAEDFLSDAKSGFFDTWEHLGNRLTYHCDTHEYSTSLYLAPMVCAISPYSDNATSDRGMYDIEKGYDSLCGSIAAIALRYHVLNQLEKIGCVQHKTDGAYDGMIQILKKKK